MKCSAVVRQLNTVQYLHDAFQNVLITCKVKLIMRLYGLHICNKLESLQFRRVYISLTVLFKFIHHHSDHLQRFQITITPSARRPNKLVFQSHGRFSSSLFLHKIGTLWNCLVPQLTSVTSLPEFRKALRLHLAKYIFTTVGISFRIITL